MLQTNILRFNTKNTIEKQRNCKAKQRKMKAYLKWKLLEMPQTQKKSWHWKPKLAQHNATRRICQWQPHNNVTTRHHEEDIDNEMQSKKLRIQVCKWTSKNIKNK